MYICSSICSFDSINEKCQTFIQSKANTELKLERVGSGCDKWATTEDSEWFYDNN